MRLTRLAAAPALLLLAACGSTPTQVFDLSPRVPDVRTVAEPARGGQLIWVDKPSVAGYFDRTQMVTREGDGSHISIHEFEVWSDPPADLIQRALVDDLAHRFGTDRVMATPVAHYAEPEWRFALDVIRFDVDQGGAAVLDVRWTLLAGPTDRLVASRREWIEAPSSDPADPARRVTALSETVVILASRIGCVAGRRLDPLAPARNKPVARPRQHCPTRIQHRLAALIHIETDYIERYPPARHRIVLNRCGHDPVAAKPVREVVDESALN